MPSHKAQRQHHQHQTDARMRQHQTLVKLGQGNVSNREVGEIESVGQPVGQQIERIGDHENAQGHHHHQGPLLASAQAARSFLWHGFRARMAGGIAGRTPLKIGVERGLW